MRNILFLVALVASSVFADEEANDCGANDFALQILGSGGPFGNGRASAGYLLWVDDQSRIMIDAGGGIEPPTRGLFVGCVNDSLAESVDYSFKT